MLTTAQKAIKGIKEKEVALVAYSSGTKKKGNKKKKKGKTSVVDRKSTRLNSSHSGESRMPSSA